MRNERNAPTGPFRARLQYAATATGFYSGPALELMGKTLDKIEADLERQAAMRTCLTTLNPCGDRSDWQVALDIHEGIKRLSRVRPGRVLTPYEEALTVISTGAKSADRIHRELKALDNPYRL